MSESCFKRTLKARAKRGGWSLIEVMLLVSLSGGLILAATRAMQLATRVHEHAIHTATHLRLVTSLEDRLRSDLSRAHAVSSPSENELLLTMPTGSQVRYQLVQPTSMERQTLKEASDADGSSTPAVVDQRWPLKMSVTMKVELIASDDKTLVRVHCRRLPSGQSQNNLTSTKVMSSNFRGIEVSGVVHAR